jgi:Tfp pilus assembly protein PilN
MKFCISNDFLFYLLKMGISSLGACGISITIVFMITSSCLKSHSFKFWMLLGFGKYVSFRVTYLGLYYQL